MKKTVINISAPKNFNLQTTIISHGWYDLLPFRTNDEKSEISSVVQIPLKDFYSVIISAKSKNVSVVVTSKKLLTHSQKKNIELSVRQMLRIDEQLDEFYSLCKTEKHLWWVVKNGAGRLLRSSTVFEDVVKMLFTTNCSWSLTKIQTENLVTKLGTKISETEYSFPSPETIAAKSEQWLRKNLSCGYRAPYLLELCKKISSRKLELESLRNSNATTKELYDFLRSIKGIGHYAAGNLLKLLGHYDYLGIDSWVRKRFSELHHNGRKVSDTTIEKYYSRFGKWRGLICWMEVTKDWHV